MTVTVTMLTHTQYKNRTKVKISMGKKSKNIQRLGKSMTSLWS